MGVAAAGQWQRASLAANGKRRLCRAEGVGVAAGPAVDGARYGLGGGMWGNWGTCGAGGGVWGRGAGPGGGTRRLGALEWGVGACGGCRGLWGQGVWGWGRSGYVGQGVRICGVRCQDMSDWEALGWRCQDVWG